MAHDTNPAEDGSEDGIFRDFSGIVAVGKAPAQFFRSRLHRTQRVRWHWKFKNPQVGAVPCCPECGATVVKGSQQAAHERWHNQLNDLLEDIIREVFGTTEDQENT